MKKIVLESQGREININSLEEVVTVPEIITELIIPAFQASGFSKETINDGLSEYLDEYLPDVMAQECMSCQDLRGLNETLNIEYEKAIEQLNFYKNETRKQVDDIQELNTRLDEYEEKVDVYIKRLENVGDKEPEAEITCESCGLLNHPDCAENHDNREYCIGEGRSHWVAQEEDEGEGEPKYACDYCAGQFILADLDRDYGLCETCFEKQTCIDCGLLHDYCECNACPECGEDSENGGGELCNSCQLGRDEGDCIRTTPSFGPDDICLDCGNKNDDCNCEIYQPQKPKVPVNRVPENNVWTTGNQSTVRDGWVTPPADQVTPEPEQEDIPTTKPEDRKGFKKCPDCGGIVHEDFSVCPVTTCDHRFFGNISEEDKEKIRASEAEDDGPEQSVGGNCNKCNIFVGGLTINGLCPSCFKASREEVPKAPEAVGVWSTSELKKEGYGVEEKKVELCVHCNTIMEDTNGITICPDCNYRADCTCQECELKRRKAGIPTLTPEAKEPPKKTIELTAEEKENNLKESLKKKEEIQELSAKGKYNPSDWSGDVLSCSTINKYFYNVNCKDMCSKCPIGQRTIKHGMEHGLFYCGSCEKYHTRPFPDGFCPTCGIRSTSSDKGEFCRRHWDTNRANNGYEADEEENWKDGDENDPDRYNDDEGDY